MRAGLSWFWRQPFLRATSLVATTRTFTMTSLYLVVIVIERERGASAALIGLTFAFVGIGGLIGSLAAPWFSRHVSMRTVIVATAVVGATLVPLLSILPGRAAPGIAFGAMWILNPVWSTVVGAHRLRIAPPELRARVVSIAAAVAGALCRSRQSWRVCCSKLRARGRPCSCSPGSWSSARRSRSQAEPSETRPTGLRRLPVSRRTSSGVGQRPFA
jgi:hypothetical protein